MFIRISLKLGLANYKYFTLSQVLHFHKAFKIVPTYDKATATSLECIVTFKALIISSNVISKPFLLQQFKLQGCFWSYWNTKLQKGCRCCPVAFLAAVVCWIMFEVLFKQDSIKLYKKRGNIQTALLSLRDSFELCFLQYCLVENLAGFVRF